MTQNQCETGKRSNRRICTGEILYYLFFGSLLFAKGIGLYDGQTVFKLVLIFASACLLLKLLIEEYTLAEYAAIVVILGLTGLTYVTSGEKGLLLYGMMAVGMKNVDIKRVFKLGTVLWTVAFLGTTITSLFHMEDTVYKVHDKLGLGHIFRWSLGYPHPNVLQISYLLLAIFILYWLGERFHIKHAIYLLLGGLWVFLYSVSYTGIALLLFLLAGRIYLYFRKNLSKAEMLILQLILPVSAAFSLIAPIALKGRAFDIVNKLLSTRLQLGKIYLTADNISLFGQDYANISNEVLTLDNSYQFAFIAYGIIPFALLVVALFCTIHILLKKEQYLEALITLTIIVGGLTEPFLFNTSFRNISFLFLGDILFKASRGFEKNTQSDTTRTMHGLLPRKWRLHLNRNFLHRGCVFSRRKSDFADASTLNIAPVTESNESKHRQILYKIAFGITCASIAMLIANAVISYPDGYVVARKDSSGVSEETHYYSEADSQPENYLKMANFTEGDMIEYFSGNIVRMEKFRSLATTGIFGFFIGSGCMYMMERRRRER